MTRRNHFSARCALHCAAALLGAACAGAYALPGDGALAQAGTGALALPGTGALALPGDSALAQPGAGIRSTIDLVYTQGRLSAGLPDAQALNGRATWVFVNGDVARAELLDERKFDHRGGLAGLGYTKVMSPDWTLAGNLAFGHGPFDWARTRVDIEASANWGAQRSVVTRAALYHARFDGVRSDRGLRLGLVAYFGGPLVLEAGVAFNVSQPGTVRSQMPYLSATFGQEGVQYLSLRASRGSEAYQAIGVDSQLVDFNSRSIGIGWRRWIAPRWGFTAQAEHYHNPSYERITLGAGLFWQW